MMVYADDQEVFAEDMADAQHNLDVLSAALAAAGLTINVKKTEYIVRAAAPSHAVPHPVAALPPEIETLACGTLWFRATGDRNLQCPACPMVINKQDTMRHHLHSQHGLRVAVTKDRPTYVESVPVLPTPDGKWICPVCTKTYALRSTAVTHYRKAQCHTNPPGQYGWESQSLGRPLVLEKEVEGPIASPQPRELKVYGRTIKRVKTFTYLGRVVSEDDSDAAAINARIGVANGTFWAISKKFLSAKKVSVKSKVAVYRAVMQAQLIYGAESWVFGTDDARKLQSMQQRALRWATGLQPQVQEVDGVKEYNFPKREAVLKKAEMDHIVDIITHAQLRWLGHVLRMPEEDTVRRAFMDDMPGIGRTGFRDCLLLKSRLLGLANYCELQAGDAQDRSKWRDGIARLLPVAQQARARKGARKKTTTGNSVKGQTT